jgi:hypothetical protein
MRFDDFREGAAWLGVWLRDCFRSAPRSAVAGAAFVGGGAVFALALVVSPPDRPPGGLGPPSATSMEVARLPRLRPDEPVATGSIHRSSATVQSAQPIAAPQPAAAMADADEFRRQATRAAETFDECDRVASSRPIDIGGLKLMRIECANGLGLYLDRAMTSARLAEPAGERRAIVEIPAPIEELSRAAPATPLSDAQAVSRCEEQVRTGLPYPASLTRHGASTSVYRPGPHDAVVTFSFDALSGLRFPLLQSAYCVFSDSRLARAEITTPPY